MIFIYNTSVYDAIATVEYLAIFFLNDELIDRNQNKNL